MNTRRILELGGIAAGVLMVAFGIASLVTALATALNVSYMAEQIGLFSVVVGIALLLSGIGFIILALFVLGGSSARSRSA